MRISRKNIFRIDVLLSIVWISMAYGSGTAQGISPDVSWHLQLSGKLQHPDRDLYDIDLFDHPIETILSLREEGRVVICYFSAGTFEDWRPDKDD